MLPGVGTKDDIRAAQDNGGQICRIATHCTEADTSIQHFGLARELGLETVGFLMMSHTQPPEVLAKQARIMVDAGCQCVYVVDSAGALIMEQTADRVAAARRRDRRRGRPSASTATRTSASASPTPSSPPAPAPPRSTARSAASAPAPATRRSRRSSASATSSAGRPASTSSQIVDASEDVIKPAMPEECQLDRMTLMMGYAGVYSSFLKHAGNAADRYGVSGAKILLEAGRRKLIGGQEDQLIDIALMLKAEQDRLRSRPPERDAMAATLARCATDLGRRPRRGRLAPLAGSAVMSPRTPWSSTSSPARDADRSGRSRGCREYDARRPMTPTGTNLLGLVKHLASVELGYFGDTFGRAAAGSTLPVAGRRAPT